MKLLGQIVGIAVGFLLLSKLILWGLTFFIQPVNPWDLYAGLGGPTVKDHEAHGPLKTLKECIPQTAQCQTFEFDRDGLQLVNGALPDDMYVRKKEVVPCTFSNQVMNMCTLKESCSAKATSGTSMIMSFIDMLATG